MEPVNACSPAQRRAIKKYYNKNIEKCRENALIYKKNFKDANPEVYKERKKAENARRFEREKLKKNILKELKELLEANE